MLAASRDIHPQIGADLATTVDGAGDAAAKAKALFIGMFERPQNNVQKGRLDRRSPKPWPSRGRFVGDADRRSSPRHLRIRWRRRHLPTRPLDIAVSVDPQLSIDPFDHGRRTQALRGDGDTTARSPAACRGLRRALCRGRYRAPHRGLPRGVAADCGLDADRCAVLCRASALVKRVPVSGGGKSVGSGAVKTLARAAALRDVKGDFHRAFRLVAEALEHSLLESPPEGLASRLADPRRHPELRPIRRSSGTSSGPATPYPALTFGRYRLACGAPIQRPDPARSHRRRLGLQPAANLAMRLSGKALPSAPVSSVKADAAKPLRVDTVHGAKGETLDAVLYVVTKGHLEGLLAGTATRSAASAMSPSRDRGPLVGGRARRRLRGVAPRAEAVGLVTRVPIRSDRRIGHALPLPRRRPDRIAQAPP